MAAGLDDLLQSLRTQLLEHQQPVLLHKRQVCLVQQFVDSVHHVQAVVVPANAVGGLHIPEQHPRVLLGAQQQPLSVTKADVGRVEPVVEEADGLLWRQLHGQEERASPPYLPGAGEAQVLIPHHHFVEVAAVWLVQVEQIQMWQF